MRRVRLGPAKATSDVAWTVHENDVRYAYGSLSRIYLGGSSPFLRDDLSVSQTLTIPDKKACVTCVAWGGTLSNSSTFKAHVWTPPLLPSLAAGTSSGEVYIYRPLEIIFTSSQSAVRLSSSPTSVIRTCGRLLAMDFFSEQCIATRDPSAVVLWHRNNVSTSKFGIAYRHSKTTSAASATVRISDDGRLLAIASSSSDSISIVYRDSNDAFPTSAILRRAIEIVYRDGDRCTYTSLRTALEVTFPEKIVDAHETSLRQLLTDDNGDARQRREAKYRTLDIAVGSGVRFVSWRPTASPLASAESSANDFYDAPSSNALLVRTTDDRIRLWQEATERRPGSAPRFVQVAVLRFEGSAAWLRPTFPRPFASMGVVADSWACPPGLRPWRSAEREVRTTTTTTLTTRPGAAPLLMSRFVGPSRLHKRYDWIVLVSRKSGRVAIRRVSGFSSSSECGLRRAVHVEDVGSGTIPRAAVVDDDIVVAFARATDMISSARDVMPPNVSVHFSDRGLPGSVAMQWTPTSSDAAIGKAAIVRTIRGGGFGTALTFALASSASGTVYSVVAATDGRTTTTLQAWSSDSAPRDVARIDLATAADVAVRDKIVAVCGRDGRRTRRVVVVRDNDDDGRARNLRWGDEEKETTESSDGAVAFCGAAHLAGLDSARRRVCVWTLSSKGERPSRIVGVDGRTTTTIASFGTSSFATGYSDGSIALWKDAATIDRRLSLSTTEEDRRIERVVVRGDGRFVAASTSTRVYVWRVDANNASLEAEIVVKLSPSTSIAWTSRSGFLAIAAAREVTLYARRPSAWERVCAYDPFASEADALRALTEKDDEDEVVACAAEAPPADMCVLAVEASRDTVIVGVRARSGGGVEMHRVRVVTDATPFATPLLSIDARAVREALRGGHGKVVARAFELIDRFAVGVAEARSEDALLGTKTVTQSTTRLGRRHRSLSLSDLNRDSSAALARLPSDKSQRVDDTIDRTCRAAISLDVLMDDAGADTFDHCDATKLRNDLARVAAVGDGDEIFDSNLVDTVRSVCSLARASGGNDACASRFEVACALGLSASSVVSGDASSSEPTSRRIPVVRGALKSCDVAWAMLSEHQPTLMKRHFLDPMPVPEMPGVVAPAKRSVGSTWVRARAVGLALWVQSPDLLWRAATALARAEFLEGQRAKDRWRAAPFYVALGRVQVLAAPFEKAGEMRVADFLRRDFSVKANRDAALRNASKLLRLQRYTEAATFFMLGGQLRHMCMTVCVKHLRDPQLGLFLLRLREGGRTSATCGPIERILWEEHLLVLAREAGDQWLAAIGRWRLKQPKNALREVLGCKDVPVCDVRTPALKHAVANRATDSLLSLDFDPTLAAFSRCLSKKSVGASSSSEKKRRVAKTTAPSASLLMQQSSLFAQFAVAPAAKRPVASAPAPKRSEPSDDEDGDDPPRSAYSALSVRAARAYERMGLVHLCFAELRRSGARVAESERLSLARGLLVEELRLAERDLEHVCEASLLREIAKGKETKHDNDDAVVTVTSALERVRRRLSCAASAISGVARDSAMRHMCTICVDSNLDRAGALLGEMCIFDDPTIELLRRVRQYPTSLDNSAEAPTVASAIDLARRMSGEMDARALRREASCDRMRAECLSHMVCVALASLARRDMVSIATVFRCYWGRSSSSSSSSSLSSSSLTESLRGDGRRWLRAILRFVKTRWGGEDAWSDAEARRRNTAMVEREPTEDAIASVVHTIEWLRGPSANAMLRVARGHALLVLEWCVTRRLLKEIDDAARSMSTLSTDPTVARVVDRTRCGLAELISFQRQRLPALVPKLLETTIGPTSMHACDSALIRALSNTGILFPRPRLERHGWLWFNLEGSGALDGLVRQTSPSPWFRRGATGGVRRWDITDSSERQRQGYELLKSKASISSFALSVGRHRRVIAATSASLLKLSLGIDERTGRYRLYRRHHRDESEATIRPKRDRRLYDRVLRSATTTTTDASYEEDVVRVATHPRGLSIFATASSDASVLLRHVPQESSSSSSSSRHCRVLEWGDTEEEEEKKKTKKRDVSPTKRRKRRFGATSVRFSNDGIRVAAGSSDGVVAVWQIDGSRSLPVFRAQCHRKRVNDVALMLGGSVLATAGYSGSGPKRASVTVRDCLLPPEKSLVWSSTGVHVGGGRGARAIAISRRHQAILSCGDGGEIAAHDMRQRKTLFSVKSGGADVACIALSPCEEHFATGHSDGAVKLWSWSASSRCGDGDGGARPMPALRLEEIPRTQNRSGCDVGRDARFRATARCDGTRLVG